MKSIKITILWQHWIGDSSTRETLVQTKFSKQNISVWEVTIVVLVTEFFHLIASEVSFKVFFSQDGTKGRSETVWSSKVKCFGQLGLEPERKRGQRHQGLLGQVEFTQKLLQPQQLQWKNHHSQATDSKQSNYFKLLEPEDITMLRYVTLAYNHTKWFVTFEV